MQTQTVNAPTAADSCRAKLERLSQNAARQQPDANPVEFTQPEINAYLASGAVKMPAGVSDLEVELHPGHIVGAANIDFEKVRAGKNENNPLLGLFSGTHQVRVDSEAEGSNGQAQIHIVSAALDGVNIPHFALEMFVRKYVEPKHPNVGLDTRFTMPARVERATIGEGAATLQQR